MLYRFKACGKCGGDLVLDADEWRCFQCGHVYYPVRAREEIRFGRVDIESSTFTVEADPERQPAKVRRPARHLNPEVAATRCREEQWWNKNRQVIFHLDQGKKVREVAEIVGQGPRQIRVVRERLRDLRSAAPELVTAG